MTPSAVQRIKRNRVRAETKRAVSRLFQHSMNEMSMARRDKMRRSRCILKLKCIKLLGLDLAGNNTDGFKNVWLEQLGGYR